MGSGQWAVGSRPSATQGIRQSGDEPADLSSNIKNATHLGGIELFKPFRKHNVSFNFTDGAVGDGQVIQELTAGPAPLSLGDVRRN